MQLPSALSLLLAALLLAVSPVAAQFQLFEQMFGGGQQQAHQPQDVASDSNWYRQNWDNGA